MPAPNVTTPEALVVPINCLRTVYCVSDAPWLLVVKRVLITCLGSFSNALFFSGSTNLGIKLVSRIIPPEGSSSPSSWVKVLFALAEPASVPSNVRLLITPFLLRGVSNSKSAVKFWAAVASTITIDRHCSKVCVLSASTPPTESTVRSVLLEFSMIWLVSAESEAVIFSPLENLPEVLTTTNCVPVVVATSCTTKPVAPEVIPVIFTPPEAKFAIKVGLGVPLRVR